MPVRHVHVVVARLCEAIKLLIEEIEVLDTKATGQDTNMNYDDWKSTPPDDVSPDEVRAASVGKDVMWRARYEAMRIERDALRAKLDRVEAQAKVLDASLNLALKLIDAVMGRQPKALPKGA